MNEGGTIVGLASLCVTLLGALVMTVLKIGGIVADLREMRKSLEAVGQIPTIALKVTMLEQAMTSHFRSEHPRLEQRIQDATMRATEARAKADSIVDRE